MKKITSLLCFLLFVNGILNSPTDEKKGQAPNQALKDVEHHINEKNHDTNYDHEAFLGKEESKKFDQLTSDESKEKLGKIVDKIDANKDGKVTFEELKNWIAYISKKNIDNDTERHYKEYEINADKKLTWDNYKKRNFGDQESSEESIKKRIARDQRRWKAADIDIDGLLSQEEFSGFIHPEDAPHMRDIVASETLEDIDKNNDGFVDLQEYLDDLWQPSENDTTEPDWFVRERTGFSTNRDKNNDGKMDHEEIKSWVMPEGYDHVVAEAKHLLYHADNDKDGILSKSEIVNKYDVFVGSQATDFGDALNKHEEL